MKEITCLACSGKGNIKIRSTDKKRFEKYIKDPIKRTIMFSLMANITDIMTRVILVVPSETLIPCPACLKDVEIRVVQEFKIFQCECGVTYYHKEIK